MFPLSRVPFWHRFFEPQPFLFGLLTRKCLFRTQTGGVGKEFLGMVAFWVPLACAGQGFFLGRSRNQREVDKVLNQKKHNTWA